MAQQARIVDFEGARAASRSRTQTSRRTNARSASRTQSKARTTTRSRNSQKLKQGTSTTSKSSPAQSAKQEARATGFSRPAVHFGRKSTVALLVCVCIIACCAFLYDPAKNYYTAVREQAKAEVAYEIVSTRNEALIEDVALLTSEAGMEDRVREQYGWVKEGENAVTVTGLSHEAEPTPAEILRTITLNDIKAPETWYSPVLDPFFGYRNE